MVKEKVKNILRIPLNFYRDILSLISIKKNINRMKKRDKNKNIRIYFVLQYPEMWNSYATVYKELEVMDKVDVCVIALPKRGATKEFSFADENDAYSFCVKEGINVINAYDNGVILDPSSLYADYIVIQRPYDDHVPKEYSMNYLCKVALLIYISYSGHMTNGIHFNIEYDSMDRYFYMFFADCKESMDYVENRTKSRVFHKYQKIFNIGFPRFDLIHNRKSNEIKTFLWMPRWSLIKEQGLSHFYDYIFVLLDYFKKNPNLNLIIRPHPLMFRNFVKTGYKTQEEIDKIIDTINNIENIKLDSNSDYLDTFDMSDALISDGSSLLLEYFFTKKPVIICEVGEDFTESSQKIISTFYDINDEKQLISNINDLVNGDDEKKKLRDEMYELLCPGEKKAGAKIAGRIILCTHELKDV